MFWECWRAWNLDDTGVPAWGAWNLDDTGVPGIDSSQHLNTYDEVKPTQNPRILTWRGAVPDIGWTSRREVGVVVRSCPGLPAVLPVTGQAVSGARHRLGLKERGQSSD
ncbi:hypothetical protein NDU88_003679 [Pleurodeles waltl]|uniref:Uncharacterized protein n=1 Tax=Pleurodeles waltl TaxID=8319 RepID=A0AAV7NHC0_PLEWA|nr:hypothetical protein NDU88_003679 [Pleurodeles waltl]